MTQPLTYVFADLYLRHHLLTPGEPGYGAVSGGGDTHSEELPCSADLLDSRRLMGSLGYPGLSVDYPAGSTDPSSDLRISR